MKFYCMACNKYYKEDEVYKMEKVGVLLPSYYCKTCGDEVVPIININELGNFLHNDEEDSECGDNYPNINQITDEDLNEFKKKLNDSKDAEDIL